ncbi:LysR substrate-binding domain-containing protein [Leisingera sp. M658]|uniref:LysR substrate-binding domain-containing protein n=1 Tax=Leisingera sp. M658 TaxID=2867015 RepID=UPI0021A2D5D6|nr:LysR substrate-binding domain-containing protein [Leisingera sp. M658]UWQ74000.1 LysR family transcriptional regulator [Leisingera sp. M658]
MVNLPSLPALRAFEAAARLGSFRAAAEAIGVSPTAVSHHIRGLEAYLNIRLFTRDGRQVHLTDEGARLADGASQAFRILEATVNSVARWPEKTTIRIALGPSFATRWLLPRFADFCAKFPDVELKLVQTPLMVSPQNVDADIFITWGDGRFPGMISEPLVSVLSAPVASPALLDRLGHPQSPADLMRFPLIHQRDTLGWNAWFMQAGVRLDGPLHGPVIEDTNVVLQAAASGQGIVMGWIPLIDTDLQSGVLVQLFDKTVSENRAYYLVRPEAGPNDKVTSAISDWLLAQTSPATAV